MLYIFGLMSSEGIDRDFRVRVDSNCGPATFELIQSVALSPSKYVIIGRELALSDSVPIHGKGAGLSPVRTK